MEKIAQQRGILNRLREKTNVSGKILEKINPAFHEMMERLRAVDETVRTQAEGIRETVKTAGMQINSGDYLRAATNLAQFHEVMGNVVATLREFRQETDLKHYEYMLGNIDEQNKNQLFEYDPSKRPSKQAGFFDGFIKERASVGFIKKLKKDSVVMVGQTQEFLGHVLHAFKRFGTAVAKRDIAAYANAADDLIKRYAVYNNFFIKYYNENIVPFKAQNDRLEEVRRKNEEAKSRQLEEQRENAEFVAPKPVGAPTIKEKEEALNRLDALQPKTPSRTEKEEALDKLDALQPGLSKKDENTVPDLLKTLTSEPPSFKDLAASHRRFIDRLEKFASNNSSDPNRLANQILSYAALIEETNESCALKLVAIAEGILEDIEKKAGVLDFLKGKTDILAQNKPSVSEKTDNTRPFPVVQPVNRPKPVEHNIQLGRIDKKFLDIPFLKSISANSIKLTPGASNHIAGIFTLRLFNAKYDVHNLSANFETNIVNEIRQAVVRGIVTTAQPIDGSRDIQIEVYCYIDLSKIDRSLKGIAKPRVSCRLMVIDGTLALRTIDKNFQIEKPIEKPIEENEPDDIFDQEHDYDHQDYDDRE